MKTVYFKYTDANGWDYELTFPMPSVTVDASVDISQSPPGEARLTYTWQVSGFSGPVSGNTMNIGRPDGPVFTPELGLAYKVDLSSGGADVLGRGPCGSSGYFPETGYTFDGALCYLQPPPSNMGDAQPPYGSARDFPQAKVSQIANGLSKGAFFVSGPQETCMFLISQVGVVTGPKNCPAPYKASATLS